MTIPTEAADAAAIATVLAWVQLVKTYIPKSWWDKACPALAILSGLMYGLSIRPADQTLLAGAASGLFLGLAAAGTFVAARKLKPALTSNPKSPAEQG